MFTGFFALRGWGAPPIANLCPIIVVFRYFDTWASNFTVPRRTKSPEQIVGPNRLQADFLLVSRAAEVLYKRIAVNCNYLNI
jgi:hypothetical protein